MAKSSQVSSTGKSSHKQHGWQDSDFKDFVLPEDVVYEEDIERLVILAQTVFGPMGNIIYPHHDKNVVVNFTFGASMVKDGKLLDYGYIWYGDVLESEVAEKLNTLIQLTGCELYG